MEEISENKNRGLLLIILGMQVFLLLDTLLGGMYFSAKTAAGWGTLLFLVTCTALWLILVIQAVLDWSKK